MQAFLSYNTPLQLDPIRDSDALWHLRGFGAFNSLLTCCKLLYVTKGVGFQQYIDQVDGEAELLNLIKSASVNEALVKQINDKYRELFSAPEMESQITMFPGIEESLKRLTEHGYLLVLLSNSTEAALRRDMGHLSKYFSVL
jgi:phosphoglycolate phosphatase-like HAD superfamily hydrolase